MFSCSKTNEPVTELDRRDKQVIDAVSQNLPTYFIDEQPSDIIDSVLLSYGFIKYQNTYYLNAPGELQRCINEGKGAQIDMTLYEQQYAEIIRKGHADFQLSISRENQKYYFDITLRMLYTLPEARMYYLRFSNLYYETFVNKETDLWAAGACYVFGQKAYDINWKGRAQRLDFIEKFKQEDAAQYFEYIDHNNNQDIIGEPHVVCNLDAIFPNSEEECLWSHMSITQQNFKD